MAKSRVRSVAGLLTLGLVLAGVGWASAMDVALRVQETAGVARVADPCRSGIPLVPGALKDETRLRLLDEKGAEAPAQFRVINRRTEGDVEWVCVDFLADVPANGERTYRLTDSGPAKPIDGPVKVEDAAEAVTLVTGPLKLVVPKTSFAGLGEVWLDAGGTGQFSKVATGGALVIQGIDGKAYDSRKDLTGPLTVAVEESGPLHVVVRIDGELKAQSADGQSHYYPTYNGQTKQVDRNGIRIANRDGALGFTVRLHVWKGQTWVRAFVTMRNLNGQTNNWTEQKIQFGDYYGLTAQRPGNYLVDAVNFDVDLATTGNLRYRIGGGNEGTIIHLGQLAAGRDSVVLYQDSSAGWMWQAGTGKIWDDRLRRNYEFMKDLARTDAKAKGEDPEKAAAAARPYWEFEPMIFNELLTKRDGGSFMGYRLYQGGTEVKPGSCSSFADLGQEAGEGLRAPGWIEVDDGRVAVTAGCRWFWQMFPKSLELCAPGRLRLGLWSQYWPRGHVFEGQVHRTHELLFDFRPAGRGLDGSARFRAFTHRLVATPDARHNLATRVYGDFMLPNPEEWPNYEKSALSAVAFGVDPTSNPGRASSMEIEREKCDQYEVWKFGDSSKDSWHYFGQYQELDVPYCLMVHYARTGDLRFFRWAEEIDRLLLDIPAYGGGYGHQMGEPSHYYVIGPLLYANAAAEPFLRDAIEHSHRIVNPKTWHLRSFAIVLWSNWAMQRGFGDPERRYAAGVDQALQWWDKSQNAQTGAIGGFDRSWQVFMLGMAGDALGRYCDAQPPENVYRDRLVRAYREWMEHLKSLPADQRRKLQDKTTANGFAYAARFSSDPTLLDFAAENIVRDQDFPIVYRTGVCSAKNWSETIAAHRLIQVFLHDIDKRRHPERYKNLP